MLDRLQDAGNVGSILRSAAAFGFTQVIALHGTAALWSAKVLRAGMGAHFALHLVENAGDDALDALGAALARHQLARRRAAAGDGAALAVRLALRQRRRGLSAGLRRAARSS